MELNMKLVCLLLLFVVDLVYSNTSSKIEEMLNDPQERDALVAELSKQFFITMDSNGDNQVTVPELLQFLASNADKAESVGEAAAKILETVDVNKDGIITFEEFISKQLSETDTKDIVSEVEEEEAKEEKENKYSENQTCPKDDKH